MGILDKIKGRVKQSIEDVDWDELHSKKEDAVQKVKAKTNEYKDEILEETEAIKEKVKQTIEDVDWDELRSKKEDTIQKVKAKTNEYKDDVLEQTKAIKEELDKKYKGKIGEKLYKKEKDLKARQEIIITKEKEIKRRENELNKYFNIRKVYVYVPIGLIFLFIIMSSIEFTDDGIDLTDPNFDVGGYCLDQEKKGVMGFFVCLSDSAAKIITNRQ
jgi:Fe2+ transport system protein B